MAPTATFHRPKVEFVTKNVPTLQDPLKEIEKNEKVKKSSVDEDEVAKELKYFQIIKPCKHDKNVRYIYIDESKYGLVWPNITMFIILHAYYLYAMSKIMLVDYTQIPYRTWHFGKL